MDGDREAESRERRAWRSGERGAESREQRTEIGMNVKCGAHLCQKLLYWARQSASGDRQFCL